MADPSPLRIGILGAARIAPSALVKPARAVVAAVKDGESVPTDGWDGVRNMAVIDAIYDRAGLSRRGRQT